MMATSKSKEDYELKSWTCDVCATGNAASCQNCQLCWRNKSSAALNSQKYINRSIPDVSTASHISISPKRPKRSHPNNAGGENDTVHHHHHCQRHLQHQRKVGRVERQGICPLTFMLTHCADMLACADRAKLRIVRRRREVTTDKQLDIIRHCQSLRLTPEASVRMKRHVALMFDSGHETDTTMANIINMPTRHDRCRFVSDNGNWMKKYRTVLPDKNVSVGSLIFLTTDEYAVNIAFDFRTSRRDLAKAVTIHCGLALEHVCSEFRDDDEIVLVAVRHTGAALQFASGRLKRHRQVVLAAVSNDGYALSYASEDLRDDHHVVCRAVAQCGKALQFASRRLRDDPDVAMAAVRNEGFAIRFVSSRLRQDPDLSMAAMGHSGTALLWHSTLIRRNEGDQDGEGGTSRRRR